MRYGLLSYSLLSGLLVLIFHCFFKRESVPPGMTRRYEERDLAASVAIVRSLRGTCPAAARSHRVKADPELRMEGAAGDMTRSDLAYEAMAHRSGLRPRCAIRTPRWAS